MGRSVVCLKLQELLTMRGIDLTRTMLMRHIVPKNKKTNYEGENLEISQSLQTKNLLKEIDYLISFIGTDNTQAIYQGCYRVLKFEKCNQELLPSNFMKSDINFDKLVFWKMERTDIFEEMKGRLVIDWGKSPSRHDFWRQRATNEKEILSILPVKSEFEFTGYDKIIVPYGILKNIVENSSRHKIWEDKLSSVAGVYLITDKKTGKHYVGSASSEHNGIWGRWSGYIQTKHNYNTQLVELMNCDKNYCENFIFSLLEIFPIKKDSQEVLYYERLYKEKLCSRIFGLNDN